MPECYPIKGNIRDDGTRYFHRPDSRNYGATRAEVWFDSPSAAEAAGFALAPTHPDGANAADFEPGGSQHPCTAAAVQANRSAVAGLTGAALPEGDASMHPYGPGSHALLDSPRDMPECYPIKGNIRDDEVRYYHRPDSRNYGATRAEVWFDSPSAAEAAGFELAPVHPDGNDAADFEPGGSQHPCTAATVQANRTAVAGLTGAALGLVGGGLGDGDTGDDDDDGSGIGGAVAGAAAAVAGAAAAGAAAIGLGDDDNDDSDKAASGRGDGDTGDDDDDGSGIGGAVAGAAAAVAGAAAAGAAAIGLGDDDDDDEAAAGAAAGAAGAEVGTTRLSRTITPDDGDTDSDADSDDDSGIGGAVAGAAAAGAGAVAAGAAYLAGRSGDGDASESGGGEDDTAQLAVAGAAGAGAGASGASGAAGSAGSEPSGASASAGRSSAGGSGSAGSDGASGGGRRRWGWLWWLLAILAFLILFGLLLQACAGLLDDDDDDDDSSATTETTEQVDDDDDDADDTTTTTEADDPDEGSTDDEEDPEGPDAVSDVDLRAAALAALAAAGFGAVDVDVSDAAVTLSGTVPGAPDIDTIGTLVGEIPGVASVTNNVTVAEAEEEEPEGPSDDDLRTAVITALTGAGIDGVNVDVADANATLSGELASEADIDTAVGTTEGVDGIGGVTNDLNLSVDLQALVRDALDAAGYPDVDISIAGDVVTLTGEVPSAADRTAAEAAVSALDGVGSVNNELTVASDGGESEPADPEDGNPTFTG
ncbi:MAG: BON domain-containing protein [Actinomycetota bacterium]